MKASKYLLLLLLSLFPLVGFTQEKVKFDSINIDYGDYYNRVFYKYNMISNIVNIHGEETFSKMVIEDQKKKLTSIYKETKCRDYRVINSNITDSISDILNYLFVNNHYYITEYSKERVESDKTIIDITCYYQDKIINKRIIIEADEKYHNKFVDFLLLLTELRNTYKNISN